MKGHERPLTFLKYNRDGDLLFSCAKDHQPTVWYTDNGERVGTYKGHNGAVWTCDVSRASKLAVFCSVPVTVGGSGVSLDDQDCDLMGIAIQAPTVLVPCSYATSTIHPPRSLFPHSSSSIPFSLPYPSLFPFISRHHGFSNLLIRATGDSKMLITASADQSVKLWEVETGTPYYTFTMDGPARSVALAEGEQLAAITVDPFMGSVPAIHFCSGEEGEASSSVTLAEGEQLAAITVDPFMGSVPAIHVKRIKEGSREREWTCFVPILPRLFPTIRGGAVAAEHSPPGSNNALRAMRCVSCAACHALRAMRCVPCAACHVLRAMCCVPCTARHALRAMRCMPCAACHVLWWASQFPAPCARSSVSRLSPLLLPSEEEESVLQVTAPQGQIMRCASPCWISAAFVSLPAHAPSTSTIRGGGVEEDESVLQITGPQGRIMRCVWGPLNQTLIGTGEDCIIRMWDAEVPTQQNTHRHGGEEDCIIRMWDAETGKLLRETEPEVAHSKTVTSLSKSADGSHFITGSLDKCAKLWDTRTLRLLKTYQTERPINAADISPLFDHPHLWLLKTYQTERPINAADISPLFDHVSSSSPLLVHSHYLTNQFPSLPSQRPSPFFLPLSL
ncbi:unnamed protein product [Closterium sp. NIES-65]|nr:unnamed protein product [Closterium sp. NIES-65]